MTGALGYVCVSLRRPFGNLMGTALLAVGIAPRSVRMAEPEDKLSPPLSAAAERARTGPPGAEAAARSRSQGGGSAGSLLSETRREVLARRSIILSECRRAARMSRIASHRCHDRHGHRNVVRPALEHHEDRYGGEHGCCGG